VEGRGGGASWRWSGTCDRRARLVMRDVGFKAAGVGEGAEGEGGVGEEEERV
jgi:hypothetical protein